MGNIKEEGLEKEKWEIKGKGELKGERGIEGGSIKKGGGGKFTNGIILTDNDFNTITLDWLTLAMAAMLLCVTPAGPVAGAALSLSSRWAARASASCRAAMAASSLDFNSSTLLSSSARDFSRRKMYNNISSMYAIIMLYVKHCIFRI